MTSAKPLLPVTVLLLASLSLVGLVSPAPTDAAAARATIPSGAATHTPEIADIEEDPMAAATGMKRLTPVLMVEEIEPTLPFWVDRLGFEKTVEVPEGDKLGFVILQRDKVEVMLQSRASVANDVAALAEGPFANDGVGLFIEITGFDEWLPKLDGLEVVVPERKTFYGAREIGVRAPGGIMVMLAEFGEPPAGN